MKMRHFQPILMPKIDSVTNFLPRNVYFHSLFISSYFLQVLVDFDFSWVNTSLKLFWVIINHISDCQSDRVRAAYEI